MNGEDKKTYKINELARLSGVSVRTLRFYDEIGLLKPAYCGENGYRYYEKEQLLLLQQILFYRELDFELSEIGRLMTATDFDKAEALRNHRRYLEKEAKRFRVLIRTLDRTLSHLEKETPMKDKEMYEGFFDPKQQKKYEAELVERYGAAAQANIIESRRRTQGWKKEDYQDVAKEYDRLHRALTETLKAGAKAGDPQVQTLIREHYEVVNRFWTPDRTAYIGLGQLYCEHEHFRRMYDGYHPDLAPFLAEAMRVYAESHLPPKK
ncbi:MAG: MerR family transcriptional regulator [Bdellovibrionaceae bacterium]|nr:MerR family transcriptional regulator [Bdellovibrionales bacterium]MCB9255423.1 MerR family transcriptional regulator [Pseudobdellovibrionaceae bacterium]